MTTNFAAVRQPYHDGNWNCNAISQNSRRSPVTRYSLSSCLRSHQSKNTLFPCPTLYVRFYAVWNLEEGSCGPIPDEILLHILYTLNYKYYLFLNVFFVYWHFCDRFFFCFSFELAYILPLTSVIKIIIKLKWFLDVYNALASVFHPHFI